jgi:hypothetical protein
MLFAAWAGLAVPALIVSSRDSLTRLARGYSIASALSGFSDVNVIRKEPSRAFFDAWSGPKTLVARPGNHNEDCCPVTSEC